MNNPENLWVRSKPVFDPIVDERLFARAQKITAERYLSIPEGEMLLRLRLLKRKGQLSDIIIDNAPGVPCVQSYVKRFGSIRKPYALIGYSAELIAVGSIPKSIGLASKKSRDRACQGT